MYRVSNKKNNFFVFEPNRLKLAVSEKMFKIDNLDFGMQIKKDAKQSFSGIKYS